MPISARVTSLVFAAALLAAAPTAAAERLDILSRAEWDAKLQSFAMPENVPDRITVHHTGTPSKPGRSLAAKLQALQAFSQSKSRLADGRTKPAWGDLPYHFYIDISGDVGEGLAITSVGDTNTNYDPTGHIEVVLEGNFETEKPSAAQLDSLTRLLVDLAQRYDVPVERIGAHNDFAQTVCPGEHLLSALPATLEKVAAQL